jgi:hypothetical protein
MKPSPKAAPALRGRRDVGDERVGGAVDGARDAGERAAREQPAEVRRQAHQPVVHGEARERHQQHRTPPVVVAEVAEQGPEQELQRRKDAHQIAADARGTREVHVAELHHELGQHRHDDAEADGVDEHGEQHENERIVASRHVRPSTARPLREAPRYRAGCRGGKLCADAWRGVTR